MNTLKMMIIYNHNLFNSLQNKKYQTEKNWLIINIEKEEVSKTILERIEVLLTIGSNMLSGKRVKKKFKGKEINFFVFRIFSSIIDH